jgi:DNA-binding HxlR family transcriptional regulator/putative sterol carrier protein
MAGKRSYSEACGVARALDTVGERWALMVVREMLLGPKRFTDIRAGLPGLSPDVLAQRLKELEAAGVVRKRTLPPPAASKVYELTPAGQALEPVLIALCRWGGANAPPPLEGQGMSFDAHLVSLRTLFEPQLAEGLETTVQLVLGDERFRARVAGGELELERGEEPEAEVTIETDAGTLIDIAHGRLELSDALAADRIEITGDEDKAALFLGLFPLPAPA